MIGLSIASRSSAPADVFACFAWEGQGLSKDCGLASSILQPLLAQAKQDGFTGKKGEVYLTRFAGLPARKVALAGLGKRPEAGLESLRQAAGSVVKRCLKHHVSVRFQLPAIPGATPAEALQALAEAARLASYRFTRHRTIDEKEKPDLKAADIVAPRIPPAAARRAIEKGLAVSDAIAFVRDWVNEPPSDKRPDVLARAAKGLEGGRITVEVLGKEQIEKLGMGALLGVARGSSVPPAFIHLHYKGKGSRKRFAIIGKGITFDSGGLSLKPPQSMETMKDDMSGAATVLGVFTALSKLGVRAQVHGFAPVTYNMPGPDAVKPGDVVKALNGKTVEILNTDAEGRLILADALAYAARLKPDQMVDIATLTGAAVVALGSGVTAAMTNDRKFLARFLSSAKNTGERYWELPLVEEYKEGLKSKVADLQNISSVRGEAGTIVGGLFLKEFVDKVPWIHFDIAGTAWAGKDTALCPTGGTGVMVRSLLEYLLTL